MKTAKDIWTPPTRRAFVAMLGLGAAALAVVKVKSRSPDASPEPVAPIRWIGHC